MLVIFLTVVLDLVGFGLVIPLLTFYAESFSASPQQVTALMTVYSLAQFVAAPLWGQASDRWGRRPLLLASILMTAVMLAAFASATSLWMLFLFRGLHGIMTANIAIAQACMADLTTMETRARGMGLIGAGFGIGFTIGPWLGGELAVFGLAVPIWVAAGLSLLNFILGVFFLPETRVPGARHTHRPIDPLALGRALRHPRVGASIVLTFVFIFAFAAMESTFTLFAEHAHGLRPEQIGRLFGIVGVVGALIQGGLIHRLVKRYGEAALLPPAFLTMAVGLTALPLTPLGPPLYAEFALIASGQGVVSPALQSLISRGVSADEQGEILGSNQSMGALARAAGPLLGGWCFQHVSHGATFYVAGALLAVAAAGSVVAGRRAAAPRGA